MWRGRGKGGSTHPEHVPPSLLDMVLGEFEGTWNSTFCLKAPPFSTHPTGVAFNNQKIVACSHVSENCFSGSQRNLTDNCQTISKGLYCGRTWETWNSGGCRSVQREAPCFMEAGSEDIIRGHGEGPLLGKVWMAMENGP